MDIKAIANQAKSFGKGFAINQAPEIAQGYINMLFHQWNIDKEKVVEYVQNNNSLLEKVTPAQEEGLRKVANFIGNLDFITAELVIDAISDDFPTVASLFLGWPEANEWLEQQLEDLKSHIIPR